LLFPEPIGAWTRLMQRNSIGWTNWPFKRMGNPSSVMNNLQPENWDKVIVFTESPRTGFDEIREACPDQELIKKPCLS